MNLSHRFSSTCTNTVQEVIRDMLEIIEDPTADADDKEMANATMLEALFPTTHSGSPETRLDAWELNHTAGETDVRDILQQMDDEEAAFGERVKALLSEKGMTQQQLADAIDVGQPAVSMLLNRQSRPQQATVAKIADALGVAPTELWTW